MTKAPLFLSIHTIAGHFTVIVDSVADAVAAWEKHRDGVNTAGEFLGASDMRGDCGEVTDKHGQQVARIFYNGRVDYLASTA